MKAKEESMTSEQIVTGMGKEKKEPKEMGVRGKGSMDLLDELNILHTRKQGFIKIEEKYNEFMRDESKINNEIKDINSKIKDQKNANLEVRKIIDGNSQDIAKAKGDFEKGLSALMSEIKFKMDNAVLNFTNFDKGEYNALATIKAENYAKRHGEFDKFIDKLTQINVLSEEESNNLKKEVTKNLNLLYKTEELKNINQSNNQFYREESDKLNELQKELSLMEQELTKLRRA